jgi:hypothetical protein
MKNTHLFIVLLSLLCSTAFASPPKTLDVFANGHWNNGKNVLETHYYAASPPFCNTCHYSLSATLPGGEQISSDLCSKSSATALDCQRAGQVIYLPKKYAVSFHNTTYYDKAHQPQYSHISGVWSTAKPGRCDVSKLSIPSAGKSATVFPGVSTWGDMGHAYPLTFLLEKETEDYLPKTRYYYIRSEGDKALETRYYLVDQKGHLISDGSKIQNVVALKVFDALHFAPVLCTYTKAKA